jgi:hypothetical protein
VHPLLEALEARQAPVVEGDDLPVEDGGSAGERPAQAG